MSRRHFLNLLAAQPAKSCACVLWSESAQNRKTKNVRETGACLQFLGRFGYCLVLYFAKIIVSLCFFKPLSGIFSIVDYNGSTFNYNPNGKNYVD